MFYAMGRCKFPLYITKTMAEDNGGRIVNETRMIRNSWSFLGFDHADISPSMLAFRVMVQRNQEKAKARYERVTNSKAAALGNITEDEEEDWPVSPTDEFFGLPKEIDLTLSGCDPRWTFSSFKRTGGELTHDLGKASTP